MNLREGTRRLALLLGVAGFVVGGFISYSELQTRLKLRADNDRFEQFAASPVAQRALHSLKLACAQDPSDKPMMPDIASQWIALTPEQRKRALSRMSPGQKLSLAKLFGYQTKFDTKDSVPLDGAPAKFDTKDIVPLDGAPAKFDTKDIVPLDGAPAKFDTKDIVPLDGVPAKFDKSQIQFFDNQETPPATQGGVSAINPEPRTPANYTKEGVYGAVMGDRDPIDEFIALPRDQQLSMLRKLDPEKQNKLLAKIKERRSKQTPPATQGGVSAINPEPRTPANYAKEGVYGLGRGLQCGDEQYVPMSEINSGGIKTIYWSKDYRAGLIQTDDGQSLFAISQPYAWSYIEIALFPIIGFFVGFLVPWGVVRSILWVGAGFVAGPK